MLDVARDDIDFEASSSRICGSRSAEMNTARAPSLSAISSAWSITMFDNRPSSSTGARCARGLGAPLPDPSPAPALSADFKRRRFGRDSSLAPPLV